MQLHEVRAVGDLHVHTAILQSDADEPAELKASEPGLAVIMFREEIAVGGPQFETVEHFVEVGVDWAACEAESVVSVGLQAEIEACKRCHGPVLEKGKSEAYDSRDVEVDENGVLFYINEIVLRVVVIGFRAAGDLQVYPGADVDRSRIRYAEIDVVSHAAAVESDIV